MGDVIKFPLANPRIEIDGEPVDQNALAQHVALIRKDYLDVLAEEVFDTCLMAAARTIDSIVPDNDDQRDYTLHLIAIRETIRAYMYWLKGIDHPFNTILSGAIEVNREIIDDDFTSYSYAIRRPNETEATTEDEIIVNN